MAQTQTSSTDSIPLDLLEVLIAFRNGDFSVRMPCDRLGLEGKVADTLNEILDMEHRILLELEQVANAVGKDGATDRRLKLPRYNGGWAQRVDFINGLVGDLVQPMNEMARVIASVARGDLTQNVDLGSEGHALQGEFLHTACEVNRMVARLKRFACEVTRVAREVGTEGELGGQADLEGMEGTWKHLTDDVNSMASNLTRQVRNIAEVTVAVANGDLSKKITVDVRGEFLELKETVNTMVDQLRAFASEVTRVAREVGTEGCLGGQAVVRGAGGTWKDLTDSVNSMASNLTSQVRSIAEVTTAVANGDLGKQIKVDVQGEILQLKNTINTMVEQLGSFASEVTRVAREVGTEGRLGGQAVVKGVGGVWADLTESVNHMANNLTTQVRNIAEVTTAVAGGDLSKKITVEARNEILGLKNTINTMVDQLNAYASEVTRVAREVGTEGKLGGQAQVPGAAGVWRDLTDNVNQLAGNLTAQVRAIADVATAVTAGDLSRSVTVQAAGEVAILKDKINEMIRNLRETTIRSTEQDWLKTNLTKFTRMLQGQRDLLTVARQVLSGLAPLVGAHLGVFYLAQEGGDGLCLRLLASYAYQDRKGPRNLIRLGEGLVGQAALEQVRILLTEVPADYVQIESGLGHATPANLVVLPVLFEGEVNAVVELASCSRFSAVHLAFLEQLTESIGIVLNTISATMRKEELLKQSQALAEELQSQQEEMTQTNRGLEAQTATLRNSQILLERQQETLKQRYQDLEERTRLVSDQKAEVEAARAAIQVRAERQQQDLLSAREALEERAKVVQEQQTEVEHSRGALHEKAEQLAQASKYKSEFLANMSHDLRTPLNSLLILSRALEENADANLTPRQMEYAATIHAAGHDLLELIDDVLDLSKIESGAMELEWSAIPFRNVLLFAERTFRPIAEGKGLRFEVHLGPALPATLRTDWLRLQQVLRNLLANAFKFTEAGSVTLEVGLASSGWTPGQAALDEAPMVVSFAVKDTGIGIDPAKHGVVFEAFQQADGSTSRIYGGTGLGLSISRGITNLFGGEIVLQSAPGEGSTFTLYLPLRATAAEGAEGTLPLEPMGGSPILLLGGADAASPASPPVTREVIQEAIRVLLSITRKTPRYLLLVEDDPAQLLALREIMEGPGVETAVARTGREALEALGAAVFDCMVLDLNLPDMTGLEVLRRLREEKGRVGLPVIVHTARKFTQGEEAALRRMAETIVVKAPDSLNRVFDETALFLGRPDCPAPRVSEDAKATCRRESPLKGRKILLVDDDARNIFALRSVLESQGIHALAASTGWEALSLLELHPDTDLVLLDVMLPGLDGLDTARAIRRSEGLKDLPIIALTAKAMKGDRELCLEAGATEYLPKPVDLGQLLAAMERLVA